MVKGTSKARSFVQSKEGAQMKAKEARHNTSPARPPLSAFSASARNNLSAGNTSPTLPASNSQAKFDRRSSLVKIRGGLSGQASYPHVENADSNIGSSSSNSSSPERFSTPSGTPLKGKPKRTSSRQLPLDSANLDNAHGQNSTGVCDEGVPRTSSNPSSDEDATTTDYSDPSSTSGSEAENACLSRQASARQEGLRRMSLGPKIEAAVTKFNTPCKPLIPLAGRIGTPCASPGSLRAGVQRALVLQQPDSKDYNHAQSQFDLEENLSFWDDHSVQVVIRTRPISGKEAAKQDFNRCLRQDGPHAITWLGQPETRFTFDHVAGENISQEKLFKVVGLPIVENCMAGYNSCMFAYGQTGSGKTHTMLGDITGLGDRPSDNRGMTPRIFEYLFTKIQQDEQDRQLEQLRYVCKCSFLEIYNEQITDLLEPTSSNLQMREDSKKGVYVENLTEIVVRSVQDVVLLLLKGAASRKVASTNMNRESSRSHSVFTCSIESKWETNSLSNMRFGRLNLVDLAGSERQKSSKAEGDRLKEAASINKSLSTLGLVIMALVDIANGKPRHVPYRDSKLTFLLQDSLGGNSKTAIIATISPSSCCSMETLSTLKFAQRAKFIQNNAVVNEDAAGDVLALQREIQQLKEEVSRLRCQTISSIRRECRRDSNEFFRLSMTGRDLFDAAEKERTNEGAELKSEELLEKIKALELVLAGALRREQEADNATKQLSSEFEKAIKMIEERETELRNCKNLLHLHADESLRPQSSEENAPSSDSEQHSIFSEKLEIAGSLEYNSTVTKLELENLRLTEQLRSYLTFINAGEKETMAAEIQGLRDQVLELLDGKIAVERGFLSTTIAQDDSQLKELETCRHDLSKCLEASSQLQRQVDELHSLVNQLNAQCSDKEKELDFMKESTAKYVNMAKLKEEEINALQTGWETATAKLFRNLVEGERALIEVGQEMDEILGEDWQLKNIQDNAVRWSIESVKSLKEVDVEHDYFKGRDSCNADDMFGEKRISRRKRSSGVTPRASIMSEEKLKLEASVARLEQQLEEHKQQALKEKQIQDELDRVEREKRALKEEVEELVKNPLNTPEILEENADLKVEVQQLRVKLHEQNETIASLRAQTSALDRSLADLERVKLDQAEILAMRSQEAFGIQEENLKLLHEIATLSEELKDVRGNTEKMHADLVDMARIKDELTEKNALLKLQGDKDAVLQTCLNSQILNLEGALKTQQEEMSELETEIERLEFSLHEAECRHQDLETTMKADKGSIVVLEEAKQKLDREVKMISQKLALTDTVQEELRVTVSSLHVELEKKIKRIEELDLQAISKADARVEELNLSAASLKSCQVRIGELEASVAERSENLRKLEEALMSATATCDAVTMERDEARVHSDEVQAEATLSSRKIQELLEKVDLKSIELQILFDLMQVITTEMNTHIVHFHSTSQALNQELEHERGALGVLQHQLLSLTATLEQNQVDLLESKRKENNLLTEILRLKEELLKSECNADVTLETESCLQGELLALSEIVKSINIEKDGLKEELAALHALVLEHQSTIDIKQLKMETDAQTIALLNETIEDLQTQLQRKEDLLQGLEFDLSLLQEHAAEDTDFKQELLKANARILELQEAVQTSCEELKILCLAKNDVEDQLALKSASMTLVEDRLLKSEAEVALVTTESQKLNSRVLRLQSSSSLLEAELAEKNEALSSQENELIIARNVSARMTMDCSQKTEALLSLQGQMRSVAAERDALKSQCSILLEKVDCLQDNITQQVAEVEALHGELLVSKMTECCLLEIKSDLEIKAAVLEAQKATHDVELAHTNDDMKELNFRLLRTSETVDRLKQEMASLEAYIDELEVERVSLNSQLAQRSESGSSLQDRILAESECTSQSFAEQDMMKRQINDFQILNCRLERDLALKIDAVIALEADVLAARTQTAQSLEQTAELRAKISAFEEGYSDLERVVVLKNDAVSSMAAELSAAQAVTSSMARDLDDMKGRITTLISEKDNLEGKILLKEEAMASMDVELKTAKESVLCLESLKSKLSELELQKSKDEEELQTARKTVIALQDEIQALTNKLSDSQESYDTLKLELAERITAFSSLQDDLNMASGSSSDNHEEMRVMKAGIGALLKERDSLTAEVGHKSATISSLEAELVGARESAESSRDCIAGLETKGLALQAEKDSVDSQITELELGVISTLRVELTEAQKTLKFIDKEMSEAKRVADCVSEENSALQAQIVGLEAEKGTLEVEVSCKTALIMSLEAELAAAGSSSMALREELNSYEAQVLELQTLNAALETEVTEKRTSISLRESELMSTNTITSSKVQENDELRMQINTWQQKCSAMEAQLDKSSQEMDTMKAQISQQELQLSSLEELLAREAEALQHMVNSAVHATQECDTLRSEVESLKDILCTKNAQLQEQENALKRLEIRMSSVGNESDEIWALKDERDQALVEVQTLHGELRAAQALVASHKSSVLEAQKFAEVNILRASGKEEEARTLKASVSSLKNQNHELEKQLEATKNEAEKLRQSCDEFEMELQGMKNRMTMLQAVHSTGSRNFKGFQAAQAASLDLQKRLEDKETEVSQMYKRMTVLHSQNEAQTSRLEEMETELAHVHQELDELQSQCEEKDAQLSALNGQLKEAETLTQDVMRDLHNVKLDISNYASLVSQQQLELIAERARHTDEAREKDEELSNLQTQLNQERQNWMVEMNHKQAEIVVARVLSEKMRLKNKTLAAEYKRLKADYSGKKKKLKFLEQQLTQITTETRRFSMGTESEADFDEVQQFQALLAQANDHERAQRKT